MQGTVAMQVHGTAESLLARFQVGRMFIVQLHVWWAEESVVKKGPWPKASFYSIQKRKKGSSVTLKAVVGQWFLFAAAPK